jgi:hypothetical protein
MQVFVKHPSTNKTFVYNCEPSTTVADLLGYVMDSMGVESKHYYALANGKHMDTFTDQGLQKSFSELGIGRESTIHLIGRLANS